MFIRFRDKQLTWAKFSPFFSIKWKKIPICCCWNSRNRYRRVKMQRKWFGLMCLEYQKVLKRTKGTKKEPFLHATFYASKDCHIKRKQMNTGRMRNHTYWHNCNCNSRYTQEINMKNMHLKELIRFRWKNWYNLTNAHARYSFA